MSKQVEYKEESVAHLRLTLVEGQIDESQLNIIEETELQHKEVRIKLAIIGSSHFVMVKVGSWELSEIFACTQFSTPQPYKFFGPLSLLREGGVNFSFDNGAHYVFSARITSDSGELNRLETLADSTETGSLQVGLSFEFPSSVEIKSNLLPKTVIWVGYDVEQRQIVVKTAHSYPNEEKVVITSTTISIPKEGTHENN